MFPDLTDQLGLIFSGELQRKGFFSLNLNLNPSSTTMLLKYRTPNILILKIFQNIGLQIDDYFG